MGTDTTGGLRIHDQAGLLLDSSDIPGPGYGVAHAPTGQVYILVGGATPGIYLWDGAGGWTLVVGTPSGLGTVRVVP